MKKMRLCHIPFIKNYIIRQTDYRTLSPSLKKQWRLMNFTLDGSFEGPF